MPLVSPIENSDRHSPIADRRTKDLTAATFQLLRQSHDMMDVAWQLLQAARSRHRPRLSQRNEATAEQAQPCETGATQSPSPATRRGQSRRYGILRS